MVSTFSFQFLLMGALEFEWESSPGYLLLDLNIIFLGAFLLKKDTQFA